MKVLLIDGKNMCYRYGHVNQTLKTSRGKPTGVLYGCLQAVLRLKKRYPTARLLVAWDGVKNGTGWRSELLPAYKANRLIKPKDKAFLDSVPGHVYTQAPILKELFQMIGIPQIESTLIEADDIIALMVGVCRRRLWKPIIYSSDKDFLQLIRLGASVIRDTAKCEPVTKKWIQTKFRCSVEDILKVRSMTKDKSDNILGVPGVGEVRAAKFVALGADPSIPSFSLLDKKVRTDCSVLEEQWSIIHRNYKLMHLAISLNKIPVPKDNLIDVKRHLKRAEKLLCKPCVDDRDYHDFLSVLSRYQLLTAIQNRHRLWTIQDIE